jgi:hypothetical protein
LLRTRYVATGLAVVSICLPRLAFGWGREGHAVIALIAGHYMTPAALKDSRELLDGESIDEVASWADEYRRFHPETGPWHYIDIPLADSQIDMPPSRITTDYERRADLAIELQLEKAGVRLAYLLNSALR